MKCLWILVFISFIQINADKENDKLLSNKGGFQASRKNYTANDLIQLLSNLAKEEVTPRLRFPSSDYDDYSDDSKYQSNLNTDEYVNSPNYYSQQNNYQNFNPDQNIPPGNRYRPQYTGPPQQGFTNQQYQYPVNQGQFNRPPKRKKRPRPPLNPQQFQISQDSLDPYLQNYPPFGSYPQNHNFPPTKYPNYPSNYPNDPNYPSGNYDPSFQGFNPQGPNPFQDQGGPFASLMNALNSIAKNDDQQCVPRLLCEVAAGGNPSYRQASFLPSFLNTESLFTLLSALTGSVSPLLVFGRAALLGVTSQGRPSSCRYAYPECPRDPDRLVEYLNNHNGGFFRFFEGLTNGQQDFSRPPQQQQQSQFGLNQLYQLFGQAQSQNNPQQGIYNQRPSYNQNMFNTRPQYESSIYDQGSGSSGVYNQRPGFNSLYNGGQNGFGSYPPRFDYQNRDNSNNNESSAIDDEAESRILNKHLSSYYGNTGSVQNEILPSSNDLHISLSYHDYRFTDDNDRLKEDKWTFPVNNRFQDQVQTNFNSIPNEQYTRNTLKFPSGSSDSFENSRKPKGIFFPNYNEDLYYPKPLPFYDYGKMIFPDRTGTGNLKFDSDKLASNSVPDIYRNEAHYYGQYGSLGGYSQNQYQSPSTKKYVYIVRGNGDPNHPEIVEARQTKTDINSGKETKATNRRNGSSWTFPSAYQGTIYNDRSFN